MRLRNRFIRTTALASAAALVLTACGDNGADEEGPDTTVDDTDTDDPAEDEEAAQPGFDACEDDPNNCNAGPVEQGGEIAFIVDQSPDSWFSYSLEGGSVYTLQALHGIYPWTGQYEPDQETYAYNMDFLAAEPELLEDGEGDEPFTYQFEIRDEAVWDDDTPITARDFEVSWKMATSEEQGHCVGCTPRATQGFDEIESIEGDDDGKTVTVTLQEGESNPEWFALFSAHSIGGGVMPAHIAEQQGFDIDDPEELGEYFQYLNETMPEFSGGPLMIAEGDLDNQIIKEPNPNWYGEDVPLDTYILRYITDEDAFVPALSNNEVQGGSPAAFNSDVLQGLEQLPNVYVNIQPGPSWSHLDVNTENEQLADVELRRAIFTAIDVDDIGQRTYGESFPDWTRRLNHIFGEDSEFFEDFVTPSDQGSGDVDQAMQILEDAGYEMDGDTLTLDGEQIGPFRLRGGDTEAVTIATQLIQSYLGDIGVEVNLEVTDDLGETLSTQDFDLMIFGWSGSPFFVSAPAQFWASDSGSNFGGYANDEVDELVGQIPQQASLEEAAELANQATELVVDDAYVLPMLETPVYLFVTESYANVRDNAATSLRGHYNIHEWGLVAQE
jgi:peptide/nickel transport system substrate-binding protein